MKRFYSLALCLCLLAVMAPARAINVLIPKNATTLPIEFLLVDSATGNAGQTGKAGSMLVKVRYNGVSATGAGTISEYDSANFPGRYYYFPTSTETGTVGLLDVEVSCSGCNNYSTSAQVYDPTMTFAPTTAQILAAFTANTTPPGWIQLDGSGNVFVSQSGNGLGNSVSFPATVSIPTAANNAMAVWNSLLNPGTAWSANTFGSLLKNYTTGPNDAAIQADVTAALNAAPPGSVTANSIWDLLQKAKLALAKAVRDLPSTQTVTGSGINRVGIVHYYPEGTVITNNTAPVGAVSLFTATTAFDALGNAAGVSYSSP